MTYELWDKKSKINGVAASHFLNEQPFKNYNGDIILIYGDNNKVSNVECKDILATIYGIDASLNIDDFMTAYFTKLEELNTEEQDG